MEDRKTRPVDVEAVQKNPLTGSESAETGPSAGPEFGSGVTPGAAAESTAETAVPVFDPRFSKTAGAAPERRVRARPMQKQRFLMGLVFSTLGIGLMLIVAVGTLQGFGINGRLSLPVVGLCMIIGLMLLGGGFGIMATAAPTFDDDEFERMVRAGDRSDPRNSQDDSDRPAVRRQNRASPGSEARSRPASEQAVA
ncbi:MAG: hypothetical protein RIK87_03205 [Fuerstiella sp.]